MRILNGIKPSDLPIVRVEGKAENIYWHRVLLSLARLRHGPEHALSDPAGALAFLAERTKTVQLGTDAYLAGVATQLQKRLRS
jgi:hypothetical protein